MKVLSVLKYGADYVLFPLFINAESTWATQMQAYSLVEMGETHSWSTG